MKIEHAIETGKLIVATAEAVLAALDKARETLAAGLPELKKALAESERMRDQLAADRADADTALDRKFGE